MLHLCNAVFGGFLHPIDSTGATTTSTSAFDIAASGNGPCYEVLAYLHVGNIAANSSAMNVEESDDNSTWSVVQGVDTTHTWTAATAASGDNKLWVAHIPMGGVRKRYLRLTITGGAGATLVAGGFIGLRANQSPNSATERGVTGAYQYVPNNT